MHLKARTDLIRILVAEDNEGDRILFSDSLDHLGLEARLHFVVDGVEALAFLKRECKFGSFGKPDLILLDLNLPRMDGKEVLAELRQDPLLRNIPVIVISNSASSDDIETCKSLGAIHYVVKPNSFESYASLVQELVQNYIPKIAHVVPLVL